MHLLILSNGDYLARRAGQHWRSAPAWLSVTDRQNLLLGRRTELKPRVSLSQVAGL